MGWVVLHPFFFFFLNSPEWLSGAVSIIFADECLQRAAMDTSANISPGSLEDSR